MPFWKLAPVEIIINYYCCLWSDNYSYMEIGKKENVYDYEVYNIALELNICKIQIHKSMAERHQPQSFN